MNTDKNRVLGNSLTTILIVALLFPSAFNFFHLYSHHDHGHCTETTQAHFHEVSLDCELCDLQITPAVTIYSLEITDTKIFNFNPRISSYNLLISKYQQLHFNLRGPPVDA